MLQHGEMSRTLCSVKLAIPKKTTTVSPFYRRHLESSTSQRQEVGVGGWGKGEQRVVA